MDGYAQQDVNNLEDRLRRMILLNGSVPDDSASDSRPRVRLPPPSNNGHQSPAPISELPGQYHLNQQWASSSSASPVSSPQNHAFPPPMPSQHQSQQPPRFLPPHLQNRAAQQQQLPQHHVSQPHPPPQHAPAAPPPRFHQGRGNFRGGPRGGGGMSRQQRNQHIQLDPDAFQRGASIQGHGRPQPMNRNLYDPNARTMQHPTMGRDVVRQRQADYLEQIAVSEVSAVDMSQAERDDKNSFRIALEEVCHRVCQANAGLPKVSLQCFGSFESGFASAGSDMDLVIVVEGQSATNACFSLLADDLPRSLEKELLRVGFGARLLTRTRVPIIKICQHPGDCLLDKLRAERERWDSLPNETKYPHLHKDEDEHAEDDLPAAVEGSIKTETAVESAATVVEKTPSGEAVEKPAKTALPGSSGDSNASESNAIDGGARQDNAKRDQSKSWTRERKVGPLDFPKDGVGIQCDINFFNPLGLHNTQMLRCYSKCDPRVRPMVLFVKSWAKTRKINSSYSGTLSSYGYVMMVLHYLMNVAKPAVLPNLQMPWRPHPGCTPPGATRVEVDGWTVDFWRNEDEIEQALLRGQMRSFNQESLGSLLAGFFQYYSSMGSGPQFRWTQQVLSLRTADGILSKDEKGWVKATTEEGDGKKIQHRYLFCIEDPFELDHNVARTVTHNGIVAIRDEFRRAYRLLLAVGNGYDHTFGDLCANLVEVDHEALEIIKRNNEILGITDGASEQFGGPREQQRRNKKAFNTQQRNGVQHEGTDSTRQYSQAQQQRPKNKALDMTDQAVFPTLGAAKETKSRRKKSGIGGNSANFSGISGNQAAAHLEDFRRKKAEAQAETTAFGAAEMVLNGDD